MRAELQVTRLWLLTGEASVVIAPNPEGNANPVTATTRAAPLLLIPPCNHSLNICCSLSCLMKIDVGGHKQKLFAKILGDALENLKEVF